MALFELDGYSGSAEVLGSLRQVKYKAGRFTIKGVSLYEANRILSILATGKLTGIQPGDGREAEAAREVMGAGESGEPAPQPTPETSPEQSDASDGKAAEGASEGGKEKRKRRTKAEVEAEKKAKAEAKAAKEKAAKEKAEKEAAAKAAAAQQQEDDDDDDDADEAPDKGANGKGASGDDAELVAELAKQRKLRDALGILVQKGFKTREALIKKATAVKDAVPVFDRCVDIPERVTRISDSLGITE